MGDNNSFQCSSAGTIEPSTGGKKVSNVSIWGTRFLAFSSVVILVIVSYFAYLLLYPLPKITGSGIQMETGEIQAGSLQRYHIRDCVNPGSQVDISRSLVNDSTPPTVEVDISFNSQRFFQCENIFLVPGATPAGNYRLVITVLQHVNPLRSEPTTFRSATFHVSNNNPNFVLPAETLDMAGNIAPTQPTVPTSSGTVTPSPSTATTRQEATTSTPPGNIEQPTVLYNTIQDVLGGLL